MNAITLMLAVFLAQVFIGSNVGASTIQITSPISGATIRSFTVLVAGLVNPIPSNEGAVKINGFTAAIDPVGKFAAIVPVGPQTINLTVTATDVNGNSLASESIPVTVQASEPAVILQPRPTEGIAPLTVSFDLTNLVPINYVSLNAKGDGAVDIQGNTLKSQSYPFHQPGLYYPTATVTDNKGNTHTAVALIQVFDAKSFDRLFQQKWQGFKNALRASDAGAALLFIAQDERAEFQGMFQHLTVPLSSIDQVLTEIRFVQMRGNTVEYEMLRADSRGTVSHLVRFVLDRDGVWRIQDL
jgi:hypothetical protein